MVIWQKLNRGEKVGVLSGVAASIVGAMGMGLAVGAVGGGSLGEKLVGVNGIAIGCLLGFFFVAGIIIVFGAFVGGAVGHAIHRFDILRTLKLGGKLGGGLGVLVLTVPAMYVGSAAWGAIELKFGENTLSNPQGLMILLLIFTLAMDTTLALGFGIGAALGRMIQGFFDQHPHESVA
jgi:hypothetical protein